MSTDACKGMPPSMQHIPYGGPVRQSFGQISCMYRAQAAYIRYAEPMIHAAGLG